MGALKPLVDRLESKLDKSGECWMWTGAKRPNGYGVIGMPRGGVESVHRVSYEIYVGPIPDAHHIDHLCRNPAIKACGNGVVPQQAFAALGVLWSRVLEEVAA